MYTINSYGRLLNKYGKERELLAIAEVTASESFLGGLSLAAYWTIEEDVFEDGILEVFEGDTRLTDAELHNMQPESDQDEPNEYWESFFGRPLVDLNPPGPEGWVTDKLRAACLKFVHKSGYDLFYRPDSLDRWEHVYMIDNEKSVDTISGFHWATCLLGKESIYRTSLCIAYNGKMFGNPQLFLLEHLEERLGGPIGLTTISKPTKTTSELLESS